jgi:hypothetical protein
MAEYGGEVFLNRGSWFSAEGVMKAIIPILVAVAAVAFCLAIRSRVQVSRTPAAAPADVHLGLRNQMLRNSRAKFSLPAAPGADETWGIVMDWGATKGTGTVPALADGTASVYLSSGGGFIGGIGQEPIRKAGQNAVAVAQELKTLTTATAACPLPERGQVTFYALTDSGVCCVHGKGASRGHEQASRSVFQVGGRHASDHHQIPTLGAAKSFRVKVMGRTLYVRG